MYDRGRRTEPAGRAGPVVVQRVFTGVRPGDVELVLRYLQANHPGAVAAFRHVSDTADVVDLDGWLRQTVGATLGQVRAGAFAHALPTTATVSSRPLRTSSLGIDGEVVRGTGDLPSDSDEEMEEFRIGIDEADYSNAQLTRLAQELFERDAPHDKRRREILADFDFGRQQLDSDWDDEPFPESGDESGTDTEGSDDEEADAYAEDDARRARTRKRLREEKELFRPDLVTKKLEVKAGSLGIYQGGKRPAKKLKVHRKEARFSRPALKKVDRSAALPPLTEQMLDDLATVNALLAEGVSLETAAKLVDSTFVVAQYRGVFFNPKRSNARSRRRHRTLDERRAPVFSSSALEDGSLGAAGYYYLSAQPDREEDLSAYREELEQRAQVIRRHLLSLRTRSVTDDARRAVPGATGNFAPRSLADVVTQLYSQNLGRFYGSLASTRHRAAGGGRLDKPLDPAFAGLPNSGNPVVSSGDVPRHATRYAYGVKPYEGHEDEVLEPAYSSSGRPKHPYSGKVYVSIHPLSDYEPGQDPTHVTSLQNEGRTNLGKTIAPERESAFGGLLPADRLVHQFPAKFPRFDKPYQWYYAERYGLTKQLFEAFRAAFARVGEGTEQTTYVEALLSDHLAAHAELLAKEAAVEHATSLGAGLVYRTGPRSFGPAVPPLKGPPPDAPKTKVDLKKLLARLGHSSSGASSSSSSSPRIAAPRDFRRQVADAYGAVRDIDGDELACFIRSLVTAAAVRGHIGEDAIEGVVETVRDHLGDVGLRTRAEMIDAGGLVAAEVRRVLHELTHQAFDVAVHIVMWNDTAGRITTFQANHGTVDVWLLYTPGHFDLIERD